MSLRVETGWACVVVHVARKAPEANPQSCGSGEIDWLTQTRIGAEVRARLWGQLKVRSSRVESELESVLSRGLRDYWRSRSRSRPGCRPRGRRHSGRRAAESRRA